MKADSLMYLAGFGLAGWALYTLWKKTTATTGTGGGMLSAPTTPGGTTGGSKPVTDAQAAANRDALWRQLQSQPDFWI